MFYVDFMVPPDSATMQNAKQYVEDLKVHHNSRMPFEGTVGAWSCSSNTSSLIYGYSVMKQFTVAFANQNKFLVKYVWYIS